MGTVPMHEWKMPMKHRGMLSFLYGPLGLRQSGGHHGQGGVPTKMARTKFYKGIGTYLRNLQRDSIYFQLR
jgi:hypothetical protein